MRFLFQSCDYFIKAFHVGAAHAINNGAFQGKQMTIDSSRQFSPLRRQPNDKSATIGCSYLACDQATLRETIENAG
jgi:hypothetical protein